MNVSLIEDWLTALRSYHGPTTHYLNFDRGHDGIIKWKTAFSPLGLLCETYLAAGGLLSIVPEIRTYGHIYFYRDPGQTGSKSDADFVPPKRVIDALGLGRSGSDMVEMVLAVTKTDLFSYSQIADMVEMWYLKKAEKNGVDSTE